MNNTTLGNASLLPSEDIFHLAISNIISPMLRLPVGIYILQLIISRHLITSEFYTFKAAIFEIIICLHDILGLAAFFSQNTNILVIKKFLVGFLITGRPTILTLTCLEGYLAVVKPIVYLRFKPLKYKLVLSGITWLWTLLFCVIRLLGTSPSNYTVVVVITCCCVVKLYCCIATLIALKKPGPGEVSRQKEGISNIKLKAFRIMLIITASVIFVYVPLTIVIILKSYMTQDLFLNIVNVCYTCTAICGLVQALLFLQRVGKLSLIKCL